MIEKTISQIGGIILIFISLIILIPNIGSGLCTPEEFCPWAGIIMFSFISGLSFLIWGLSEDSHKDKKSKEDLT